MPELPPRQGLYDPAFEHDACGVAFVVDMKGRPSHDIVVKQHGGSIEVETQPGEFTEIKIILPRVGALPQ